LSLCFFFNWAPRHEGVLGDWRYSSIHSLTLALARVSGEFHKPRPLYPQGNSPWYPLDRRLGGPQIRSVLGGEEKNSQPLPGLEPPIIQPVAQRFTNAVIYVVKLDEAWSWSLNSISFRNIKSVQLCLHPLMSWWWLKGFH
jgi:hypothetical protein